MVDPETPDPHAGGSLPNWLKGEAVEVQHSGTHPDRWLRHIASPHTHAHTHAGVTHRHTRTGVRITHA